MMLFEDRDQDDFSSSSGHAFNENRPKRNLNTRRAIKDTRTSEKALRVDSEPPVQELKSDLSVSDRENVAQQQNIIKQIELGDYILPPDKKEETLGGIKSCKTTEYADPYETKQIMEALKARGQKGIRYSALPESGPSFSAAPPHTERSLSVPVNSGHDFIYDLAKPLNDKNTLSKSNKEDFRHTNCEGNATVSGTSVDSGVEDPDEYDHTATWTINSKNKMAQVMPNPCKTENHIVSDQKDKQFCGQGPIPQCQDQVYAGPYEDPWDSSGSKQKFDNIITKAKKEYRKTSQSDDYEEPVVASAYEEAWDLKSKEQDLENQVQEAHRRMSEGQQNLKRVQRPRKNYDYFEPWNAPNTPKSQEHSPTKLKNGKPADVYSDAYEDPWDIKQREREQALEKQFSNAHTPKSPKDEFEVPNFPAPPPPKTQTYEEAWERCQSSQFPARSPHNSGHSPNQRRNTEGQIRPSRMEFAERIDPNLPLDIQPFYHGKIARKDAEDLLRIHKEGSYLVRRSETQANVFSLSLKGVGGMPMHLRISLGGGLYILGENSKPFPTVPEMINFYTRSELPVLKADRIKLLHPIPRHY